MTKTRFVIVGTGVTGTTALIQLVDKLSLYKKRGLIKPEDIEIITVEKENENGAGLPYSIKNVIPSHRLNHTAKTIAIKPTDKEADFSVLGWESYDFINWMKENKEWIIEQYPELVKEPHPDIDLKDWQPDQDTFYPRGLFGLYMNSRFNEAKSLARQQGFGVESYLGHEAIDGKTTGDKFFLIVKSLDSRNEIVFEADKVLLATGHWLEKETAEYERTGQFFESPYPTTDTIKKIIPDQPLVGGKPKTIVVQGMGLSAIDAILSMVNSGRFERDNKGVMKFHPVKNQAKIIAVSRSGRFPIVRGKKVGYSPKYLTQKKLDEKKGSDGKLHYGSLMQLLDKEVSRALGKDASFLEVADPHKDGAEKLREDLQKAKKGNVIHNIMYTTVGLQPFSQFDDESISLFSEYLGSVFLKNIAAMSQEVAEKMLALIDSGTLEIKGLGYNFTKPIIENNRLKIEYTDNDNKKHIIEPDYLIKATGDPTCVETHPSQLMHNLNDKGEISLYKINIRGKKTTKGGVAVDYSDYAVKKAIGGKSDNLHAIGLLIHGWQAERDFASASIEAAGTLTSKWSEYLIHKDKHKTNVEKYTSGKAGKIGRSGP